MHRNDEKKKNEEKLKEGVYFDYSYEKKKM